MSETLDLVDYRRRVAESYARVRAGGEGELTWFAWRSDRDDLFATHPQTPVEDPASYIALPYFPYDPAWRTTGRFLPSPVGSLDVEHSDGGGSTSFITAGTLHFVLRGQDFSLQALWLDAYGGGLFVPFRDVTSGDSTYGGGRYVLDTAKGADLGSDGDDVVLDFNYAYHPSCVHSPRWSCPLAPPTNRLDIAVTAGERLR